MAGLGCDDDTRTALHDHLTELFEDKRRPVEIDPLNRLGRGMRR